ncbi:MAG: dTDP-glucose 4,6-dehydratase [Prochlorococcus marinus XMU1428]|nr:dTDP-glucose 4,6-dehydratase [Prochlorococcus marinus XMU1428]
MDIPYKKLDGKKVLITGGAGFIGSALIRRLLLNTQAKIINLDKLGYCSDLSSIDNLNEQIKIKKRYKFFKVDLSNESATFDILNAIKPDFVFHLAAESHVDNSINNPKLFIESNILGTFNLLQACLDIYKKKSITERNNFRFHHISTDEVFGTLGESGFFNENSNYDPRSPYSASKASSDHLVKAWHHTYELPIVITNCSNNFGPWQYPEKLIPLVIHNALQWKEIPIYGDGSNVRDWLYIEDHINGILLVALKGEIGTNYCIGGNGELTNLKLVEIICDYLDDVVPKESSFRELITFVKDRRGHDFRYCIDASLIRDKLNWKPEYKLSTSMKKTFLWYVKNQKWCANILKKK